VYSLQAYYWLGFLLADGHFSKKGRLKIGLAAKDIDILLKFREFLSVDGVTIHKGKTNTGHSYVGMQVMDVTTMQILCDMYNIHSNKTENPPNISGVKGDNLTALSIGYIDGNGGIRRQHNRRDSIIHVKANTPWLGALSYMFGREAYLNKDGYVVLNITEASLVRNLKNFGLVNKLPVLKRKWDVIDDNFVSRMEGIKERDAHIMQMVHSGFNYKDISEKLGVSRQILPSVVFRHNLKLRQSNL
jgi:hypothetical protein